MREEIDDLAEIVDQENRKNVNIKNCQNFCIITFGRILLLDRFTSEKVTTTRIHTRLGTS